MNVVLEDHYTGEEINAAVNRGEGFSDAFPGETAGDLRALRELFQRKALLARQSRLRSDRRRRSASSTGPDAERCRELRRALGIDASDDAPAFVTGDGDAGGGVRRALLAHGVADRAVPRDQRRHVPRPAEDPLRRGGGGMRAARLHAYHEALKLDEVDEPKAVGPLDVIVKIGAAGLCRTDLHIQEGQWAEKSEVKLPYTPGHENAGWVHEIGSDVTNVEVGDTVIVHPFISCGLCRACRRGDDMHCENGSFPGINRDGGFADFLLTSARSVVKLDPSLHPTQIAALADAGLTAIHAVKKAIPVLGAGTRAVVIGAGGLGHIGIQCLKAYTPSEIIVVDPNDEGAGARGRARRRPHGQGRRHRSATRSPSSPTASAPRRSSTSSARRAPSRTAIEMVQDGGFYYVIGYGENINVPTIDVISREISFIGNLVGTYVDLQDLMTLTAQGKVTLHTSTYPLDAINDAMADLDNGRLQGRGILVPAGA